MAQENEDGQEKSESATEERRELFRNKGDIAHSREITSVLVLCAGLAFLTYSAGGGITDLKRLLGSQFREAGSMQLTPASTLGHLRFLWVAMLKLVIPLFIVSGGVAMASTFAQTRFNFSFERLSPQWSKLNPWSGLKRMISFQAAMELGKSMGKMFAVGLVSYLILFSETRRLPGLINVEMTQTWTYWMKITRLLFWSVSILLLLIAALDYIQQFFTLERKMKMTKQELKEEYKQREVDPMIKGRMRRMQRDLANRKTIDATKKATVIITNPTHFAVALRYEFGMRAPIVVAKGADLVALRMREVAAANEIPIVENKPLARTLFKIGEIDHEIPDTLYKSVSEVIRYVFKIKGVKIGPS